MLSWIDSWVPARLTGDEARRAKVLVRLAFLVAPWALIIGAILTILEPDWSGIVVGLIAVACGLAVLLVNRLGNVVLATHLLLAGILQSLVLSAMMLGGVATPPTQWIMLIPLIATATGGLRTGTIWTVIAMLSALVLHGFQAAGWVSDIYLTDGFEYLGTVSSMAIYSLLGLALVANDQLYRGLLERVRAAEEAERRANQAKSLFLANMSHEIRTPLNAILGYTEMLAEDAEDLEQAGMVRDLGRVNRSGSNLLALVNDILDLSKIESGKMPMLLEQVFLAPLIQDVAAELEPLVATRKNTLVLELEDVSVWADAARVRQCVVNILSNAAKFTESGTITVRLNPGRIEVEDTGIGMSPEQLSRVFDPFSQASETTSREYGGTGLGMAIVKRLIELMEGEITAQSTLGVGSVFSIVLPVKG